MQKTILAIALAILAWGYPLVAAGCASAPAVEGTTDNAPIADTGSPRMDTDTLTGIVSKRTEKAGTLNEYSYFVLETAMNERIVLFNTKGRSLGFGDWVGRKVRIDGVKGIGRINDMGKKEEGIFVKSMEIAE